MRKVILAIVTLSLLSLIGCKPVLNQSDLLSGVWRNDSEKLDYHFGPNDYLDVVGPEGAIHSSECTFTTEKPLESQTLVVWFHCPQIDWPGYAESHEFIFSEDYKTFSDTMYIQGIASKRYDGIFNKVTD